MPRHNERCRNCKTSLLKLLSALYGEVESNWDLDLPANLEGYANTQIAGSLEHIHSALRNYRGFGSFVRSRKLPRVDFFVPKDSIIIEFDESQHFTRPREISLGLYPTDGRYGFSVKRWRALCNDLQKRDNDPPFRDEQRAWYDTLRDFAPMVLGKGNTIRLFARDFEWCSLKPNNELDLQRFRRMIGEG